MALNLGRLDYRAELSADDIARLNRALDALEHIWDNLQDPAAPIQCNDFHFSFSTDPTQTGNIAFTGPDITFGDTTQTTNVTVNFIGAPSFPTYLTIGPSVKFNVTVPIYLDACLILAGEQPAAPTNAPTVTVNTGTLGGWGSGNTYFKITYVDDSGAESEASPEAGPHNPLGGPTITFGLNNTPPAEVVYWRIYATEPPAASGTETLIVANDNQQTIYDIPVGTTSYTIPRPIYTTVTPPTAQTQPYSCFLPPCWCGKPTWTALDCEIVIDSCATPPTIWVQRDAPSGTNWQNIIGTKNRGDLITHNAVDAVLLPISTNGKVLRVTNSDAAWDGGNYNSVTTQILSHTPSDGFQWIGIPSAGAADLTVDSTTVTLEPPGVTHPVSAIRFDSDVFQAWTDNIDPTRADVGIVLPDAEIILGQGNSTLAMPKAMSQDATITNSGAVTVRGLEAIPFNATVAAPITGDLITFDGTNYVAAAPTGVALTMLGRLTSGISGITALKVTGLSGNATLGVAEFSVTSGVMAQLGVGMLIDNSMTAFPVGATITHLDLLGLLVHVTAVSSTSGPITFDATPQGYQFIEQAYDVVTGEPYDKPGGITGTCVEVNGLLAFEQFVFLWLRGTFSGIDLYQFQRDPPDILPIASGGTGTDHFAADEVVISDASGNLTTAGVMTNGQLVLGVTNSAPTVASMSQDATITNSGAVTVKGWYTHPLNSATMSSPNTGDFAYYDGTQWQALPIGTNAQILRVTNSSIPGWDGTNFNSSVEQLLEHDTSGNFTWISPGSSTTPGSATKWIPAQIDYTQPVVTITQAGGNKDVLNLCKPGTSTPIDPIGGYAVLRVLWHTSTSWSSSNGPLDLLLLDDTVGHPQTSVSVGANVTSAVGYWKMSFNMPNNVGYQIVETQYSEYRIYGLIGDTPQSPTWSQGHTDVLIEVLKIQ